MCSLLVVILMAAGFQAALAGSLDGLALVKDTGVYTSTSSAGSAVCAGPISLVPQPTSLYPEARDFQKGMCSGNVYCFAKYIPPQYISATAACPEDYDYSSDGGKAVCVMKKMKCDSGLSYTDAGQCCTTASSVSCSVDVGSSCAADCSTCEPICKENKYYKVVEDAYASHAKESLKLPLVIGAKVAAGKAIKEVPVLLAGKHKIHKPSTLTKTLVTEQVCYSKCCKTHTKLICAAPKTETRLAPVQYQCPGGCPYNSAIGKCVVSGGGYAECDAGYVACNVYGRKACVAISDCFGIEACKFVGALYAHLPKVECPSSSLTYTTLGSGAGTTVSAGVSSTPITTVSAGAGSTGSSGGSSTGSSGTSSVPITTVSTGSTGGGSVPITTVSNGAGSTPPSSGADNTSMTSVSVQAPGTNVSVRSP
eukprot:jgi/Chrzof1/6007/Cz17g00140.t1